jgi:hypothetical protein
MRRRKSSRSGCRQEGPKGAAMPLRSFEAREPLRFFYSVFFGYHGDNIYLDYIHYLYFKFNYTLTTMIVTLFFLAIFSFKTVRT